MNCPSKYGGYQGMDCDMDVSRRGLAGVVAGAIAGGKEVANAIAGMGAGVNMSLGSAPSLLQSAEVAPSIDPLYNHPLASIFRARWEYRRRIMEMTGGHDPNVAAIKSYSHVYRTMKHAEPNIYRDHWMDELRKYLGLPTEKLR